MHEMDFAFKAEDKKKESVDVEPQLTMPEAALNEKEDGTQQPVDEPRRSPPVRFGVDEFADVARADHVAFNAYQIEEPSTIGEALSSEYSRQWKEDADSEFEALMDNEAWELVDLPEGREAIWLRRMLTELGASPGCAILIPGASYCLCQESGCTCKDKTYYQYIREAIQDGTIDVQYVKELCQKLRVPIPYRLFNLQFVH